MDFISLFNQEENKKLLNELNNKKEIILSGIGSITTKAFLLVSFFRLHKKSIFVFVDNYEKSLELIDSINFWSKYEIYVSILDETNQVEVIDFVNTINNFSGIFIIKKDVLDNKFPSYNTLINSSILVETGTEFRNVEIFNSLIQSGYEVSYDVILSKGQYRRSGGMLDIFPLNSENPYKIEIEFDRVSNIWSYDQKEKKIKNKVNKLDIFPLFYNDPRSEFFDILNSDSILLFDEIEIEKNRKKELKNKLRIFFTSFPLSEKNYFHLRYLSVLKFYNLPDFLTDIREKIERDWIIIIVSKRSREIKNIFIEEKIAFKEKLVKVDKGVFVIDSSKHGVLPTSFQNPILKFELITDREIFSLKKSIKNKSLKKISLEFLSSLKEGDFVVHFDHGIGHFLGIIQREIDTVVREYLEIAYAENDKLFVPVDQADKVTKYISAEEAEENEPRLSRLGSQEWKNITNRVKKETEKIAKELLNLYAQRSQAKGYIYNEDNELQRKFESEFPYEETPGQMKAIKDIKDDMESNKPMDRLICGDVGFGKTEVAMRAAFKAVMSDKQVAFVSPITILADQHYRTLVKRMKHFGVKVEMLSRFRTKKEQKEILKSLRLGKIDIIIGTHRLLQADVEFLDLGLVIIDEEQRFGVKQKEVLKSMRTSIDILTLTATPIPRTLNLSLNKLRDITIITTPPPGRLPIITEVRKYSDYLIREAIMKEIERKGQIYFLHNRVETIDGIAQKLKYLVPEARFIVAHGQLNSNDLESRIIEFKEHNYDVLVSSTIIENGIDLSNANTLIVNNAESFGLSQLYQLRGRIGRGKTQAYAYFLYHTQKLKDDAKKRLKAIVEASELGAGFQIAMRDLEIRGAGEILGANQHGMMNIVGVGHFIRLLNKTIEEMKSGKGKENNDEENNVVLELPVEAYIPNSYISDQKEKISVYQKLSSVDNKKLLDDLKEDIEEEYGDMPKEVGKLFTLLFIKILCRKAGINRIKSEVNSKKTKDIVIYLTETVTPKKIINVLNHNENWKISGNKIVIDIKYLGFNWLDGLKDSIKKLI